MTSDNPMQQEKRRGNLRVCILGAPWILPTLAGFSNIGIAVDLKIPLTMDALLLPTRPMMTDVFYSSPHKNSFPSLQISDLYPKKNCDFVYLL